MRVLDAFSWVGDRFQNVKEDHGGQYVTADCPLRVHRHATVRFWCGESGKLVFKCWSCQERLEILRAVGADWKMCFPQDVDWKAVKREEVAKYFYRNEQGDTLYVCVRLEPGYGGKDKTFVQKRKCPETGKWVNNLEGVRRVLYRLPELLAKRNRGKTVCCVPGEKDVESLRTIGVLATTNVCGERAEWLDSYSDTLAGRDVVVVQDADAVGARHANEVCGSLMRTAASVRRVTLPEKDATAYLNALRQLDHTEPATLREIFWDTIECAGRTWAPRTAAGSETN